MPSYFITWNINVNADDHEDAAMQAKAIMQDPASTATIFSVTDEATDITAVIDTELEDGKPIIIRDERV